MSFSILILKSKPIFDAKYFIPITGMILGNSLKSTIMSLNNFFNIFERSENEYIYSIGLGASRIEALKNYIKSSVSAVLKPAVADMATLGIVALPGMMTGQILGGSSPMKAVKYQIAIMILIFAAKIYNSVLLMYLSSYFFFDDYDMPITSIFKKR
jgi:putative ABC transport system permease protein